MAVIEEVFRILYRIGFLDVFIPLLLVFIFMYQMLERTDILGKKSKNYSTVISACVALIVVGGLHWVNIINAITQWAALALVVGMIGLIMMKTMGAEFGSGNFPRIIAFSVIGIIAAYTLGVTDMIDFSYVTNVIVPIVLGLLVFGGLIYLIIREPSSASAKSSSSSKVQGPKPPSGVKSLGRTSVNP